MHSQTRKNIIFFFLLCGLCLATWLLQQNANPDLSWLMIAAKRLLSGGYYANNFFETNPPLILYFYIPSIFLSRIGSLSLMAAFKLYILFFASFSFYLCYRLSNVIFFNQSIFLHRLFLFTVALVFLILPAGEFGQREHLLVLLTLPYQLALVSRLQGFVPSQKFALLTGLLAGIGFAFKPQFFMILVLLELYYFFKQPRLKYTLRTELLTIFLFFILYAIIVFILHRDYLTIVVPYITHFYYQGYSSPLRAMLLLPILIYAGLLSILLMFYKENPLRQLTTIFMLALIGAFGSYLLQYKISYYYILPLFSYATFIILLFFGSVLLQPNKIQQPFLLLVITLLALFLWLYNPAIWVQIVFAPKLFFLYFFILFALVFLSAYSHVLSWQYFIKLISLFLITFFFTSMVKKTDWYPYQFAFTISMLFALLFCCLPRTAIKKQNFVLIATVATLMFAYPVNYLYCRYAADMMNKRLVAEGALSVFLKQHALSHSVYFFTTHPFHHAYLGTEALTFASRFPFFWMLPGIVKTMQQQPQSASKASEGFANMVAEDLIIAKPDFIFIEAQHDKVFLQGIDFDYLTYFMRYKSFRSAWQSYDYLTTLLVHNTYTFEEYHIDVYRHKQAVDDKV